MPVSSDFKHSKHDPVDNNRVIDSVSCMTRTGKGVGFGSQKSSRFGEMSPTPKTTKRPNTVGSLPPSSPVEHKSVHSTSPNVVSMYGKECKVDSESLTRTTSSGRQWTASMGSSTKPKPFSKEALERRRTMPLQNRSASAFSPVVIVDENLASREKGQERPGSRTSSFCNGRRSTPDNWGGGRRGVDSPGPIYVPKETFYRDMTRCEDKHALSIIMMDRETTGLRIGKGKRFTPGLGSFETMSAPNVSPGPFVYHIEDSDKHTLPSHPTPATFKPRRNHGSMEYEITKSNTPSSKYDNVSGAALNTLSVYSTPSFLSFGHAAREAPLTGDFVFMSAPPTSKMQRRSYVPRLPASTGSHAHNQYYSWT